MKYLIYPQVLLMLWGPLLILLLTALTRRWREGLTPRAGFWLSLGLLLLPVLMWFVPYLPQLPLREWLPYRAPIAWGVYNGSREFTWLEWRLLTVPVLVAFVSMVASAAYGLLEEVVAWRRVRRLPQRQEAGCVVLEVPGELAFTLGVFRPRLHLSRSVWDGPHRDVVLAHEQAHAHERHPLWLALARWSRRSLWYWPFTQGLLREVTLSAELAADEQAVKTAGTPALARALRGMLPAPTSAAALSFSTPGTLSRRVQRLARSGRRLSRLEGAGLGLLYLALLILL